MLEDDNGENSFSVSCPEVDLLEQLNKMDINAEDSGNLLGVSTDDTNCSGNAAISRASSKLLIRTNAVFDLNRASSKMKSAINLITEQIFPLDEKSIIVSQWTSVLNLFKEHLEASDIPYVSITGQVPIKDRNDIVVNFNSKNSKIRVGIKIISCNYIKLGITFFFFF